MFRPVFIAFLISLILIIWLLSGLLIHDNESISAERISKRNHKELFSVRVKNYTATIIDREVIVYAQTAPSREVLLKSQTNGKVEFVSDKRGIEILESDLIIKIEINDREEKINQAKAILSQRKIEYEAAKILSESEFLSESKLAEANANLESAISQLKSITLDFNYTKISAPFNGILNDRYVEIGDYLEVGDVVAEIIDLDPIVITGEITENDISNIYVGQECTARFPDRKQLIGKIRYISPRSSENIRTFTIEMQSNNPENKIHAGITCEIILPIESIKSHLISPALLSLDNLGNIGVKIINEFNEVKFINTEIVKSDDNGLWLTGLPETVKIITVGHQFVKVDEIVNPVLESGSDKFENKPSNLLINDSSSNIDIELNK